MTAAANNCCAAARLCQCWLCQCLTLWCQWCSGELATALSDCSQLTQLCPTGPEVTEPSWPGWDEDDDLSVSLQGVAADTISHLADLGRTVTRLEIYGEQRQHGQAADIRAQRMADTVTRCPPFADIRAQRMADTE